MPAINIKSHTEIMQNDRSYTFETSQQKNETISKFDVDSKGNKKNSVKCKQKATNQPIYWMFGDENV